MGVYFSVTLKKIRNVCSGCQINPIFQVFIKDISKDLKIQI